MSLPPHSIEAEQSLIGAIFLDSETISRVSELVHSPAQFYRTAHGNVYAAMKSLHSRGIEIDWLTVSAEMEKRCTLETIGGINELRQYCEDTPTSAGAIAYAAIVHDKHIMRLAIQGAYRIIELSNRPMVTTAEIRSEVAELAEGIVSGNIGLVADLDKLQQTLTEHLVALQNGTPPNLMRTGHAELDNRLAGGWHRGGLSVLGAPSGVGKTWHAWAMMESFVRVNEGMNAGIVSLEMQAEELVFRQVIGDFVEVAGMDGKLNENILADAYQRMLTFCDTKRIQISSIGSADIDGIAERVRALHAKGCGLIVVDYLQIVRSSDRNDASAHGQRLASTLKSLAIRLGVHILVLSQYNREGMRARGFAAMTMVDFKGHDGSHLTDAAHNVFVVSRFTPRILTDDRSMEAIRRRVEERLGDTGVAQLSRVTMQRIIKARRGTEGTITWRTIERGVATLPLIDGQLYDTIKGAK